MWAMLQSQSFGSGEKNHCSQVHLCPPPILSSLCCKPADALDALRKQLVPPSDPRVNTSRDISKSWKLLVIQGFTAYCCEASMEINEDHSNEYKQRLFIQNFQTARESITINCIWQRLQYKWRIKC